jgi:ATP-binding cassette subfamily E protein 1
MTRVAVLDRDRCRPRDCGTVCYRFCPMVRSGIEAIQFDGGKKPKIVEPLCSGCGICIKKCPFKAISIVNLPDELEEECSYRFDLNAFKLFKLPIPKSKTVLGLIGRNGIGKSTALKILAGEIKPNLGNFENPPQWHEVIRHYRGSVLQDYFSLLSEGKIVVAHKPQYVDVVPKAIANTNVKESLEKIDERGKLDELIAEMSLSSFLERKIGVLSGGELQRFAIAATICIEANIYLFDEPSSYLDVKQRIAASRAIRNLKKDGKMVVVAEHDLAVLDYLSDHICIFYGEPGVYGVVSSVYGVKVGINRYLDGNLPDENMRFRDSAITFEIKPPITTWKTQNIILKWNEMKKSYDNFTLTTDSGVVHKGEVIGIVGPNGIGKTTFVKMLAGIEKPDSGNTSALDGVKISYKPQYISVNFNGTVENLLKSISKNDFYSSWYRSEVLQPLNIETILDRNVNVLSGGELQRTAIAACLSNPASIYLLDEPSAYLDVEERLVMTRTIRRIVESRGVSAFVVDHDIVTQDFVVDRIMIFQGEQSYRGHAKFLASLRESMNAFLKEMNITFRREPMTGRPRVNKEDSKLDRYQKGIGEYYYEPKLEEDT